LTGLRLGGGPVEERGTRFSRQVAEDAAGEGLRKTFRLPLRQQGDFFSGVCDLDKSVNGRFDGENSNNGLVRSDDVSWITLTDRMRIVNTEAWEKKGG